MTAVTEARPLARRAYLVSGVRFRVKKQMTECGSDIFDVCGSVVLTPEPPPAAELLIS
jgi:hypothetical protein